MTMQLLPVWVAYRDHLTDLLPVSTRLVAPANLFDDALPTPSLFFALTVYLYTYDQPQKKK